MSDTDRTLLAPPTPTIPQAAPTAEAAEDDEIDLRALFSQLLALRWVILGIFFLCFAAGVFYAFTAPPVYLAEGLIQVEDGKGGGLSRAGADFDISSALGINQSKVPSEIDIIKSRSVAEVVVDRLALDRSVRPVRFPWLGQWFARRFEAKGEPGLAPAPLGLDGYAWGGEKLQLQYLQVPRLLMGQTLVLHVTAPDAFTVEYDGDTIAQGAWASASRSAPRSPVSPRPPSRWRTCKRAPGSASRSRNIRACKSWTTCARASKPAKPRATAACSKPATKTPRPPTRAKCCKPSSTPTCAKTPNAAPKKRSACSPS